MPSRIIRQSGSNISTAWSRQTLAESGQIAQIAIHSLTGRIIEGTSYLQLLYSSTQMHKVPDYLVPWPFDQDQVENPDHPTDPDIDQNTPENFASLNPEPQGCS